MKIHKNYYYVFTVALTMSEEQTKCPICGTANDGDAESCKLCKTRLSKKEDGTLKVTSPKSSGKTFDVIDIEDPITRKKLEELTLIPGVNRKKALFLYRSGIQSMEEFLQKAFHGERYSDNYARTVSNKLLMQSLKGKIKEQELLCPSCQASNPMDASKCKVCNFEIEKEMAAVDIGSVSDKLSESVTEMMDDLGEDADFDALPDELKAQFASVLNSDDVDFDMEKPVDMEALDIDLEKIDEIGENAEISEEDVELSDTETEPSETEAVSSEAEDDEPVVETEPEEAETIAEEEAIPDEPFVETEPEEEEETVPEEAETIAEEEAIPDEPVVEAESEEEEETAPEEVDTSTEEEAVSEEPVVEAEPEEPEPAPEPEKKLSAKEEKIHKVLSGKVEQWRKAGYEVDDLKQYYSDIETFKVKAKEALKKGKVVQKKFEKQMEMWREKGFDVSELEPLLKTDIDAFQEKAKEVLKKQKK